MGDVRLVGAAAVGSRAPDPRRYRGDHEEHPRRAGARPAQGARGGPEHAVPRAATFRRGRRCGMTERIGQEELDELRSGVRDFLAAKAGEELVHRLVDTDAPYDDAVWAQMAEQLGLQALVLPAEHGGDGYGFAPPRGVLGEMGRAPLPHGVPPPPG